MRRVLQNWRPGGNRLVKIDSWAPSREVVPHGPVGDSAEEAGPLVRSGGPFTPEHPQAASLPSAAGTQRAAREVVEPVQASGDAPASAVLVSAGSGPSALQL